MTEKKALAIDGTPFVIEYDHVDFDAEMETFLRNLGAGADNPDADEWYHSLLKDSFAYEGDEGSNDQYRNICAYLVDTEVPQLDALHALITPDKPLLRSGIVFVNPRSGERCVSCQHVGVNHAAINGEMLQSLVDYFYRNRGALPFYMGLVFYLFYERLHPSEDGNGRLGRLVFVENARFGSVFPVSSALVGLNLPETKELYAYFNFPRVVPNDQYDPDEWMREPEDSEKYFRIYVRKGIVLKIIRVLLAALLWEAAKSSAS